ncbi:MAG: hypothetical protein IPM93_09150 [Candidatus Obscuribacter sp.]|nr:hypothetical protein [Candidatus Obscuribacter sp.]
MLLINSSFVGGLGGASKAAGFVHHLNQRAIEYRLVTDLRSVEKLNLVGLTPDIVFEATPDMSADSIYKEVRQQLRSVKYDGMLSFGWRTFVPANAIERSVPAIIIDGGWPERLEDMPSPFCKDIYRQLKAYCLTNYFFDRRLGDLLPMKDQINFQWIAQPFPKEDVSWFRALAEARKAHSLNHAGAEKATSAKAKCTIFLDLNPEYIDMHQGTFTGGWLTPRQLDECRGFVSRLLIELDAAKHPLQLVLHEKIVAELSPVVSKCKNLKIIGHPSLPPAEHHKLRNTADLVLLRASRCVGAAQTALSMVPALHTICPTARDYMGESYSAAIAEDLGIACCLNHEGFSLREGIMDYLDSGKAAQVAQRAQEMAISTWQERGPDFVLNLLYSAPKSESKHTGRQGWNQEICA